VKSSILNPAIDRASANLIKLRRLIGRHHLHLLVTGFAPRFYRAIPAAEYQQTVLFDGDLDSSFRVCHRLSI